MFDSKFLKSLVLGTVIVGGIWLLVNRDQLNEPADVIELAKNTLGWQETTTEPFPLESENSSTVQPSSYIRQPQIPVHTVSRQRTIGKIDGVIRIASFRLNPSLTQLQSFEPIHLMAEICRQYDIVVLQNLDRGDMVWLKALTDQMNTAGAVSTENRPVLDNGNRADYQYISDRTRRKGMTQTAMIFNRETIQLDHSRWYSIDDPENVFQIDPMVAWFRALGAEPHLQFTFSLASVEIDPKRPDKELPQLGLLIRAIRNDGRGEDDVILAGDFQSDDRGLDFIRNQAGLAWVVSRRPTTIYGDRQLDNIVFSEPATTEFTGRGGVIEFHRNYNLQMSDALSISDRLPIWAEFSIEEN